MKTEVPEKKKPKGKAAMKAEQQLRPADTAAQPEAKARPVKKGKKK